MPEAIMLLGAGAAVVGFMKALPASARVTVYNLSFITGLIAPTPC